MLDSAEAKRRTVVVLLVLLASGLLLRLAYVATPGFATDVGTFRAWAMRVAQIGPPNFYAKDYFSDYPPAILYVLGLLGSTFSGEPLRLAVKALPILGDLCVALLVGGFFYRRGELKAAVWAVSLWMLAPFAIFAGTFWGQVDVLPSGVALGAIFAAGRGWWPLAGALAATAALGKPQFGITALVLGAAAIFDLLQTRKARPLIGLCLGGLVATLVLAAPFKLLPGQDGGTDLVALVSGAAGNYPYTSLYAFNGWSIALDFWKSDSAYFALSAVLLAVGLVASILPLWFKRDLGALLAVAAVASMAFYFLPTRAHERYLFPAFVFLLPLVAIRPRLRWPYLTASLTFFITLYFAFTRYPINNLVTPPFIETTLFSRPGQIALALMLIGSCFLIGYRLLRGEAALEAGVKSTAGAQPNVPVSASNVPTKVRALPAAFNWGRAPSKRTILLAAMFALLVLGTRGFRLDWPREMYFDEVYHARTAFELLAQKEPYEWTHPHLAKEVMALGILAFGNDRVVDTQEGPAFSFNTFAISANGTRAYSDGEKIRTTNRAGAVLAEIKNQSVKTLNFDEDKLYVTSLNASGEVKLVQYDSDKLIATGVTLTIPNVRDVQSVSVVKGRAALATSNGVYVYATFTSAPNLVPLQTRALTFNDVGNELFLVTQDGTLKGIDPTNGRELRSVTGGRASGNVVYLASTQRVFSSRVDEGIIDYFTIAPEGKHEQMTLSNARTGEFTSGATALVSVPRSQFLYTLIEGKTVVVEPHGASAFTSIPVSGTHLGVDNKNDRLVVVGERILENIDTGSHALAWRIPGVLAGALLTFVLVLLARRLFATKLVAIFFGIALVLDGAMFAQSRIGMNDIYVALAIVTGWYFIVCAHQTTRTRSQIGYLAVAGLVLGLACAAKWAGVYTLVGVGVLSVIETGYAFLKGDAKGGVLNLRRYKGLNLVLLSVLFGLLPVAVYLASYLPWFGGPTAPYGWTLVELHKQMYGYHSGLTSPHPAGSPWWSWPFVLKPVYWYFGSGESGNAVIYDAGNIVLFWGAFVATCWSTYVIIRKRSWNIAFVLFCLLVQFVAWVPISRVLFFYHFFTALPFYLLLLAVALAYVWHTRSRIIVLSYLALGFGAAIFFYPFVAGVPVTGASSDAFFILPTWSYNCQFYPSLTCSSLPTSFELPDSVVQMAAPMLLTLVALVCGSLAIFWTRLQTWYARRSGRQLAP